jgi:heterotetrameric sarcosine oxidase gamma subunit
MKPFDLLGLPAERLVAIDGVVPPDALSGFTVLRLGAREYLVLDAGIADLPELPDALAVDVGEAWAGWSLAGEGAEDLLMRGCALDIPGIAPGDATRTVMAGVTVLLRRTGAARWELRVDRSYAAWFEDFLRGL